jgi:hypothetical protein
MQQLGWLILELNRFYPPGVTLTQPGASPRRPETMAWPVESVYRTARRFGKKVEALLGESSR